MDLATLCQPIRSFVPIVQPKARQTLPTCPSLVPWNTIEGPLLKLGTSEIKRSVQQLLTTDGIQSEMVLSSGLTAGEFSILYLWELDKRKKLQNQKSRRQASPHHSSSDDDDE